MYVFFPPPESFFGWNKTGGCLIPKRQLHIESGQFFLSFVNHFLLKGGYSYFV